MTGFGSPALIAMTFVPRVIASSILLTSSDDDWPAPVTIETFWPGLRFGLRLGTGLLEQVRSLASDGMITVIFLPSALALVVPESGPRRAVARTAAGRNRDERGHHPHSDESSPYHHSSWSCEPVVRASGDITAAGANDQADEVLMVLRGRDRFPDLSALPEHHGTVGDLHHVVQVVRDQDHGDALLGQAPDELEDLGGLAQAEGRGRLVEDHDAAGEGDGARHGDGLALAADMRPSGLSRSLIRTWRRSSCSRQRSVISFWRSSPRGPSQRGRRSSRPMKKLAAGVRLPKSARSW